MPDAGRQIWEIRVLRDVELTPLENRNKQEKNKDNEKGTKRNEKIKKMRDERKDNEKWSFIKWSVVWSPWNTIWVYLSFLSKPRTQAHITYLKSSFWLNVDTWTEEFFFLEKFLFFIINRAVVSFPQPKFLINHSPVRDEFLSA